MVIKFISRVALLLLLAFGIAFAVNKVLPANQKSYLATLNDKHARLDSLTEAQEAKMVLIGGSNVAFGLRSDWFEEAFEMPVVNMGLHAGLRYEYMIKEVWESVQKDDVFLIFPEFSQMYDPLSTGGKIIYQSLEVFPEGAAYCNQGNQLQQIRFKGNAFLEVFQIKVKRNLSKFVDKKGGNLDYQRGIFDHYGDIWTDETLKSKYKGNDKHLEQNAGREPSEDFITLTNDFAKHCADRGARVLFLYPAIADIKFDADVVSETDQFLRENLDVEIINDAADYVYPKDLFYDTKYHTTQAGRDKRTQQTIEELKGHL
jgi:hypothetical protein